MKKQWKVVILAAFLSASCSFTALAGWYQKSDGDYMYYDEYGKVVREEWIQDAEKWYYIDYDGIMVKNSFRTLNNELYYFNEKGEMVTNQWVLSPNNKYKYAGSDGKFIKNMQSPDGYWIDEYGYWDESIPQWSTPEETTATQESAETSYDGYGDIIAYQAAHPLSDEQKQKLWEKTIKRTKDRLKYPNTSRFPEWNHEGISFNVFYNEKTSEDTISVSGWCEAKNGMGNYIETSIHTYYDYNTWKEITIVSLN